MATINRTTIANEDSRKSLTSAAIRGAVGSVVAGPVGLAAGAVSGKNKSKTTFVIEYSNGTKKVETVKTNSTKYKEYLLYLNGEPPRTMTAQDRLDESNDNWAEAKENIKNIFGKK